MVVIAFYTLLLFLIMNVPKTMFLLFLKMTELRTSHEAVTLELEASNSEQIQVVKQQYEESLKGTFILSCTPFKKLQNLKLLQGINQQSTC